MGAFDWLFGSSSTAPAATAPAPAPAAPVPTAMPSYQDFLKQYANAAAANEKVTGGNHLLAWLTGAGRDAAVANAQAAAPEAYFHLLQSQGAAQGAQLGAGQTAAILRAQGFNPDPITGTVASPAAPAPQAASPLMPPQGAAPPAPAGAPPGMTPSLTTGLPPAIQAAAGGTPTLPPSVAPTGTAPLALPTAKGAPPALVQPSGQAVDPMAVRRAFLMHTAELYSRFPTTAATAVQMLNAARTGIPAGTDLDMNGRVVDSVTRQPINLTAQDYAAQGASKISTAQENARVGPTETIANHQAALDRQTASEKAKLDFTHTMTGPNGEAVPVSNFDLANRTGPTAAPGMSFPPAENPYRATQIKEVTGAQKDAAGATQMQQDVDQLGGAIAQFGTSGPWAQKALSVLQGLNQAGLLDKETSAKVGAGELAVLTSNNVAAGMARQLTQGGRMLAGVFNQVVKAKPSIMTSNPAQALEALHQEMQRQIDKAQFVADYYSNHANASKLDASSAFDKAAPIAKYESYVLPAPPPPRAQLKMGYAYRMPDGQTAVFDGKQFQHYSGLGKP